MKTRASAEALEPRRLLSLVIDLRLANTGGKAITVDHVGQVVQMDAWAVVTGNNANISDDGLQIAVGSLLSSNTGGGSVRGDLSATRVAPFDGTGSTDPVQADLDGDGDLDAGSNDEANAGDFLAVRSASVTTGGAASALGGAEFKIAKVTFAVTSLLGGASTQITFRPRSAFTGALWREDGQIALKTQNTGSYTGGTPVVVHSTGGPLAPATLAGTVFNDVNQNGVRNSGEGGLAGRTVFLDADQDAKLDAGEKSTQTDSAGRYLFDDLAGGSYHVAQVIPPGSIQLAPTGAEHNITLADGENRNFVDFADSTLSQIRGAVYDDVNRNGQRDTGEPARQGISVYIDSNHNAAPDAGEQLVATDSAGAFTLKNLTVKTYEIRAKNPLANDKFLPAVHTVAITAGGSTVSGVNFGVQPVQPITGTISGTVRRDSNADGIQQESDARLSPWLVWLDANDDGDIDANEPIGVTDAAGFYKFTSVPAGTYNLRAETTPGLKVISPAAGKYLVSITQQGQIVGSKNFFLAASAPTATITGTVYDDVDADGVRDAGEKPMGNWRLYLDANRNALFDPDERTTLTNADGAFTFGNLFPGTYRVRETLRSGYRRVTPASGYYDFTVAAGATKGGANFGNTTLSTVAAAVHQGAIRNAGAAAGTPGAWRALNCGDDDDGIIT